MGWQIAVRATLRAADINGEQATIEQATIEHYIQRSPDLMAGRKDRRSVFIRRER